MRTEEFKHIILPMRSDLKAYALRLTESDDNAEDSELSGGNQKGNHWLYRYGGQLAWAYCRTNYGSGIIGFGR